jgi:hypothetical protein
MSINAMTNVALSRRPDYEPQDQLPRGVTEVARAASKDPTPENTVSTAL